jgi:hypothetical protein
VATSAAASGASEPAGEGEGEGAAAGGEASPPPEEEKAAEVGGIKGWWAKAGKIDRSTIAALGGAALLSYGFVSNVFYVSVGLYKFSCIQFTHNVKAPGFNP